MPKENDPLNDRLDKISEAIVFLTKKVSSMEEQVNKEKLRKATHAPLDIPPRPLDAPPRPMYGSPQEFVRPEAFDKIPESSPRAFVRPETSFIEGSGSKFYAGKDEVKGESFETEIGLKWLGRIGVLALVVGAAFFMKYAFENDWIGEAGRVAIGIFSGMVLIFLGDIFRQKYTGYAATLTGGGIAVLYLSIYASFAYYHFVDQIPAFIFMMIITAIGSFLAVRYEQVTLAVLSLMGGFLTPILLSTGENEQISLFSYMTILNLGVLAISFFRNWQKLNLLGFIATLFLYFGWAGEYYDASQLFLTEAFLTLWFIIYSVAIVSHNILSRKKTDVADLVLVILNALIYFGISYSLLSENYGDYLGFFTVLMAVVYFIFTYVSYQTNPEDKELGLFFPGLSLFFLTISAPIQFDGVWVTIAWALEAAALVIVGFYFRSYAMRFFAWTILGVVVVRLIFIDNYEIVSAADYMIIFNKRFLAFLVGVVSLSAVYYLYSRYESSVAREESKAKPVALFLLHLLLIWNLSSEVSTYFSNQIQAKNLNEGYPACQRWTYDSRGRSVENAVCLGRINEYNANRNSNLENAKNIESKKNAVLNVLWSFYAIILLAFGIQGKNRLLRLMGVGLLGIAIAKLFLYGFMAMQGIYRVIAFIFIGVVLLMASYAYNKYKEKIKEII